MGDGFTAVDKRNLETTGMSESLNPTMTADYRLQDVDLSLFCTQRDAALLFTIMLLDNSNISLLHIYCMTEGLARTHTWQQAR